MFLSEDVAQRHTYKGLSIPRADMSHFVLIALLGLLGGAAPPPHGPPDTRGGVLATAPSIASAERAVLAGVRDHTRGIDEAGLYVLLNHVKRWRPGQFDDQAVAVRREDLVSRPDDYRGRLVKLEAYYGESQSFRPLNRRRYPQRAYSTLGWDREDRQGVSLITVDDPGRIRPKAGVVFVGYFFKLRRDEGRAPDPHTGETVLTIPVLVGRSLRVGASTGPAAVGNAGSKVALVLGLLLLAVLWLWLRIRINRRGAARSRTRPIAERVEPDADEEPIELEALVREETPDASAEPMQAGEFAGEGPRRCEHCGAANRVSARFCDQCGAALDEV